MGSIPEGELDFGEAEVDSQHLGEVMQAHGAEDVGSEAKRIGGPAAGGWGVGEVFAVGVA